MKPEVETVTETPAEPVEVDGITTHSVETDLAALNKERDLEAEEQESMDPQPAAVVEEPKEETPKEPKKSRSQRRIERLAQENLELKAKLEAKPAVETPAPEAKEIDINDYEDYESYEAAVKAAEKQEPSEVKQSTPSSPETPPTTPAREGDILDLLDEGKEAYEDFSELVGAEDLALTEDILDYVLDTDNGTDMTYYLATHKDETLEIAQMTPAARVKALAKIEIKLENKPPKTVRTTQAPKPITPATGISATGKTLNDDNLSFKEHEALLNARDQKSAGGFL